MKYLFLILIVIAVIVLVETMMTRRLINIGVGLADAAVPFQRELPDAEMKILMIGDSTCVGTGADTADSSLAGLVGKTYPKASITNLGVNGAKTHELIPRLEKLKGQRFDLIMLHIGGNDSVRRTDLQELEVSIKKVLELSNGLSDHVVLTSTGNLATARLLPFGTRWIFERQTLKVREIFKREAERVGMIYNDIFREKALDPFAIDPDKYYASDSFHPSTIGYADWFTIIKKGLVQLPFEITKEEQTDSV
jgi:lysophospholipase L1-like esterase